MATNSPDAYKGAQDPDSASSEFNVRDFHIRQVLAQMEHATLVRVTAVTNSGDMAAVGFVDVVPLIEQQDGYGNLVEGNTVYDVPYFRMQGGTRAVIIDPVVGDIGIAVIADKDVSTVKATKTAALPGSRRRNSLADALYIGGVLNGTPTSVLRMKGDDVFVQCPGDFTVIAGGNITMQASGAFSTVATDVSLEATDGSAQMTGNFNVNGEVTANGIDLSTHTHSGVTAGAANTGAPNP